MEILGIRIQYKLSYATYQLCYSNLYAKVCIVKAFQIQTYLGSIFDSAEFPAAAPESSPEEPPLKPPTSSPRHVVVSGSTSEFIIPVNEAGVLEEIPWILWALNLVVKCGKLFCLMKVVPCRRSEFPNCFKKP